ncbi:hypothetical protein F2Q68_00046029 [Brassica cretica]|uniref:RCC1-like domain-containing protein n=1 Tax=Brassica cretica TaxID=69181 RepID=A0A8S9LMU6_BRACR|nr:hypothetical protein F2Q68_00046029 [Brassica cretica]
MDTTTSNSIVSPSSTTLQLCSIIPENPLAAMELPLLPSFLSLKRHCLSNSSAPGEFFLASCPSIVLHLLTTCDLCPRDLAKLEASHRDDDDALSCLVSDFVLFLRRRVPSLGSLQTSLRTFNSPSQRSQLSTFAKRSRREKSQALAGPGHSIAVTSKGVVYSFGSNTSGQLGQGTIEDTWQPRPIRSLSGIRIIQAAIGADRTMLISDAGEVYAFGKDCFSQPGLEDQDTKLITTPQRVKSLTEIFVVQAAIGYHFTAVLSREGRVYTLSWGKDERLGHGSDRNCVLPHPLLGALENIPVVQIAAGFCYLLALACQPTGMSVYSVGCGLGGKLGHGTQTSEKQPRLIEEFSVLKMEPVMISAGTWHAAAVGRDGRVCTWGWGRFGCLGHGTGESELVPKVVEGLKDVKAVHVATGDYTTFVVSDDGQVYSFGSGEFANLGQVSLSVCSCFRCLRQWCLYFHLGLFQQGDEDDNTLTPNLVSSLKEIKERVVHVSLTNSISWGGHTFAMTESGTVYAFGTGDRGQLGVELGDNLTERAEPAKVVGIDLS